MELTIEEKTILAHVLVDPDTWVAHALTHGGEDVVRKKIDRWREDYLAVVALPNYMTRAQRDAYKSPDQIATEAAQAQAHAAQVAKQKAKLAAIIAELPSWATLRDEIEAMIVAAQAATTVNQLSKPLVDLAKHYRKKLKILYWIAKDQED